MYLLCTSYELLMNFVRNSHELLLSLQTSYAHFIKYAHLLFYKLSYETLTNLALTSHIFYNF